MKKLIMLSAACLFVLGAFANPVHKTKQEAPKAATQAAPATQPAAKSESKPAAKKNVKEAKPAETKKADVKKVPATK